MRTILPGWFDHLVQSFSYSEVQIKKFCLPVKTSSPSEENVPETPVDELECIMFTVCHKLYPGMESEI